MTTRRYSDLMGEAGAYITISLCLQEPVEITDFAKVFASIGEQFDDFVKAKHPSISGKARFYVKEVRNGSIIADLVPDIRDFIGLMDSVLIVTGFSGLVAGCVKTYISGGKKEGASKSDIRHIADMITAVASVP